MLCTHGNKLYTHFSFFASSNHVAGGMSQEGQVSAPLKVSEGNFAVMAQHQGPPDLVRPCGDT